MRLRIAGVVLLGIAYVLGSHWLMTRDPEAPWNAVVLIAPMLAAAAAGTWRARQHGRSLLLMGLIAGLIAQGLMGVKLPVPLLYLGQHVGIHLMLAMWFASSLRPGAQPLIAAMASLVHRNFTPDMARYCRHVTQAWVVYFSGMAAVSVLLFATASFNTWAVFANLLTPLSVGLMGLGERSLRYWLHPEFERASLADAFRAYQALGRDKPAAESAP